MTQVGGDSQNTMPVAINAGITAAQIAKVTPVAQGAPKFAMDAFKQSLQNGAFKQSLQSNAQLAEHLAQQGGMTRLAAKIPQIRNWLGPDYGLNEVIGKHAPGMMSKVPILSRFAGPGSLGGVPVGRVTQIALEGGDVAKKLVEAGVPKEVAKEIAEASAKRAGSAVAGVATAVATNAADDIARQAVGLTLKKGFTKVSEEAVKKALASPNALEALKDLGFYAKDAKALVGQAAKSTGESVAKAATQQATQETAKSGAKGLFGKIFGGIKGNFVVAGLISLGSNAIQVATGKMTWKQFFVLTAMDTVAYGAIGWGSAAAGAAIGTALFPGVGTIAGFIIGAGLGFAGGWLYEKFLRNPVRDNLLGGVPSGGASEPGYQAGNDPAAGDQLPPNPYASYGPPGAAPAGGYQMPGPAYDTSFQQAMAAIDAMQSRG